MKYALIGCGRISPNHIAAAQNNKLELIAVCDIDPACMEDKVRKFKLGESVKRYTDYREMVETEKPELVAICTESGKHAQIALFCIEHGCNYDCGCGCDYCGGDYAAREGLRLPSEPV